jgi:hypothetical protein
MNGHVEVIAAKLTDGGTGGSSGSLLTCRRVI